MLRAQAYHPKPWIEQRKRFFYDYDADELTPDTHRINVPMYVLSVAQKSEFIVTVHQQDVRIEGSKDYIDIGVSVMKANEKYGTFTLMAGTGNTVERQSGTELFELPAGKYLVVPTTTGIKLKESLANDKAGKDPATTAKNAAASLVPLVRENDSGDMVFTGT
jgi:hypothetical protein